MENWAALFVRAASPGSVLRLAERWGRGPDAPAALLLSDAAAPAGWRALTVPPEYLAWTEGLAPRLAAAFPPEVFLLARTQGRWRRGRFAAEGEPEVVEEDAPLPARPGLFRLPWQRAVAPPEIVWARANGLPIDRVPRRGVASLRQVDYETVASLDQRSLLIEDSPRLYRFPL